MTTIEIETENSNTYILFIRPPLEHWPKYIPSWHGSDNTVFNYLLFSGKEFSVRYLIEESKSPTRELPCLYCPCSRHFISSVSKIIAFLKKSGVTLEGDIQKTSSHPSTDQKDTSVNLPNVELDSETAAFEEQTRMIALLCQYISAGQHYNWFVDTKNNAELGYLLESAYLPWPTSMLRNLRKRVSTWQNCCDLLSTSSASQGIFQFLVSHLGFMPRMFSSEIDISVLSLSNAIPSAFFVNREFTLRSSFFGGIASFFLHPLFDNIPIIANTLKWELDPIYLTNENTLDLGPKLKYSMSHIFQVLNITLCKNHPELAETPSKSNLNPNNTLNFNSEAFSSDFELLSDAATATTASSSTTSSTTTYSFGSKDAHIPLYFGKNNRPSTIDCYLAGYLSLIHCIIPSSGSLNHIIEALPALSKYLKSIYFSLYQQNIIPGSSPTTLEHPGPWFILQDQFNLTDFSTSNLPQIRTHLHHHTFSTPCVSNFQYPLSFNGKNFVYPDAPESKSESTEFLSQVNPPTSS